MASCSVKSYFTPRASRADLSSAVFWRDVACELLAVTVLMTMVTFVLVSNDPNVYKLTTTHLGLFAIVIVYLLIEGYGPISGTHLNPAGSVSLFIAGRISLARAIMYVVAQIAGTAAGCGIGYLLTPEAKRGGFHAFNPENHGLTLTQSVFIEAFFTFNLIFVALSCHDSANRTHAPAVMPSLTIACCIAIGLITAGTHTGGLMNPIIALGPAILSANFHNIWVYWVGPLIGGPLAVPVYKMFIFIKEKYGPKVTPNTTSPVAAINSAVSNGVAVDQATAEQLIVLLSRLSTQLQLSSTV